MRTLGAAAAALLVAGCGLPSTPAGDPDDPHGTLACVSCHTFVDDASAPPEFRLAGILNPDAVAGNTTVPEATCTASGCHTDGGPREVSFRSVTFPHQDHGADSIAPMSCAGCHTHELGRDPLVADVSSCALCHLAEQTAGNAGECRLCHAEPAHTALTSQEVPIPHTDLPSLSGTCVRCHFDVTETTVEVSPLTCRSCHADALALTSDPGLTPELHDSHTGVACTSCHVEEGHRIQAMSTAVTLDCAQCHAEIHAVPVTTEWPGTSTCNDCHQEVHAAEQRLMLGLEDGRDAPLPSDKFLSGLSCASCHVPPPGADPSVAVRGSDAGCVGCHRTEYADVLDWWQEGSDGRLRQLETALGSARRRLAEPSAALDSAEAKIVLVADGGGHHNLLLAHRLLSEAWQGIVRAYEEAGQPVPGSPALGREPSMGLCSYCHYRVDDPWVFEEMSGPFHREVMGGG